MGWGRDRPVQRSPASAPGRPEQCPHVLPTSPASVHGNSPRKNTGVGCHALLEGIFPIQELNLPLLYLLHWQLGSLPLAPPGKPNYSYRVYVLEVQQ